MQHTDAPTYRSNGRPQAVVVYAILLVVGIMLTISATGFSRIHLLSGDLEHIVQQQSHQTALVQRMRQMAQERSLNLQAMLLAQDPFLVDDYAQRMAQNASDYIAARDALLSLEVTERERELLDQQHRQTNNTASLQMEVVALLREEAYAQAAALLRDQALPSQRRAIGMMDEFIANKRRQNLATLESTARTIRQTYLLMLLLSLIGIISSLAIALRVSGRINNEILQREQTEKALRKRELHERTIRENIIDGVLTLNEDGTILSCNRACSKIFGHSIEAMEGQSAAMLIPGFVHNHDGNELGAHLRHWEQRMTGRGRRFTGKRANGERFPAELDISRISQEGEEVYIAVVRDISDQVRARERLIEFQHQLEQRVHERTEALQESNRQLRHEIAEREQIQEELVYLANHDPLTQLPNRASFSQHLATSLHQARRHQRITALLFLDLDGFKAINDTHGHAIGDKVLLEVAARLREQVRKEDMVARMGGDEFTVLLSEINSTDDATLVAQKLIEALNQPMHCDNHICRLGTSIGISVFPHNADNPDALLRLADDAMYAAKESGKNTWCISACCATLPGKEQAR